MGALPTWAELEPPSRRSPPRCAATWPRSAACCARAASAAPTWRCAPSPRSWPQTAPEVTSTRAGHPPPHRGLQALARGPARAEQAAADPGHHRAPARHAADVLRPDRRMGLGRSPAPGADVPRRPAPPGPPAAQGPRRRRPPRSCCAPPRTTRGCWSASPWRCCCAPGCGSGSSPRLRADAVVLIGAGPLAARPGRQAPRGPLPAAAPAPGHPDRRLPRRARPAGHPLLLPRENGRALDRHAVTRCINKAGAAAGLRHIHPHQLRHTLATQAINRGMSLEAIAAMLGHRSLDMTLRYAKIANRTVAEEYFAVTEKVEALYGQPAQLPADAIGPKMARLRREHHRHARQRLLHPARRAGLRVRVHLRDLHASSRPASSSGPPCPPSTTTPPPTARPTAKTLRQPHPPASTRPSIMISLTTITRIMPRNGRGFGRRLAAGTPADSVKKSPEVAWGPGSVAPPAANRRPPRSFPPTAAPPPRRPHPRRRSRRGAPWTRRTDRR